LDGSCVIIGMAISTPEQEEAIRSTVPGSKWYYRSMSGWNEGVVERVTKTVVIMTTGERISKASHMSGSGQTWFPPTPDIVETYEAEQLKAAAKTLWMMALGNLQLAAQRATPAQLRELAAQVNNAIDLFNNTIQRAEANESV